MLQLCLLLMHEAAVGMAGKSSKEKPACWSALLFPPKLPSVSSGGKGNARKQIFILVFPNAVVVGSRNISRVCMPLNGPKYFFHNVNS